MEPLNYSLDVKSPFEQSVAGLQTGLSINDNALKRQDADRARQRQVQMQTALADLSRKPNAGAKDYSQVMVAFPEVAEHLKKGYDILQPEQQKEDLAHATQVYAAINSNQPDIAIKLLNDRATAQRNSGREDLAKAAETMGKLIELHPETAKTSAGLFLSSILGTDKFATAFPAIGKEGRDTTLFPSQLQESEGKGRAATAEATIKELDAGNTPEAISLRNGNTRAQIASTYAGITNNADRLALDKDRLRTDVEKFLYEMKQKEGTLTDDARKLLNEAAVDSVTARQQSAKLIDLAGRFEQVNPRDGILAKGAEAWKSVVGSQEEVTNLRKEYLRLRSTGVLKMLPPGPASDRDIELANKGFPEETYNSTEIASFLRGMAKLSQYDAVMNSAKAEWVNNNGHLGSAKKDVVIDGVAVPAGTTFPDFSAKFLARKAEELGAEQSIGQARELKRGYLRYGQPEGETTGGAQTGRTARPL